MPDTSLPKQHKSDMGKHASQTQKFFADFEKETDSLVSRLPEGSSPKLLIGYSGGADSSLLLHGAVAWAQKHNYQVFTAHLHHGIRGEEADRDCAFCREQSASLGVTFLTKTVNIPQMAMAQKESTESVARRCRYEWFADLMQTYDIPLLLTAHNADDELETLLFRLARGTSLSGLCGIPAFRQMDCPGQYVGRPLLYLPKKEILSLCQALNIPYVTDSTNCDTEYARNRIRLEVVPALEKLFDTPQLSALRLCRSLRQDDDYMASQCAPMWDVVTKDLPPYALRYKPLKSLHPALQTRILRHWFAENGLSPESKHLQDALILLTCEKNEGLSLSLPGGKTLSRSRGKLYLKDTYPELADRRTRFDT